MLVKLTNPRATFEQKGLPVRAAIDDDPMSGWAIDPQIEHSEPDKAEPPPQDTLIVTCSCCWAAYRYSPAEVFKGPPGPSSNCYDRGRPNNDRGRPNNKEEKKPNAVLLIAASLIAAVRLNREEIKSSPIVYSKIADSIRLAEMIQSRLRG